MQELEQKLQEFRQLRERTYRKMAEGQDATEDLSRLSAMHALLVRDAVRLLNLVVLQKDSFYLPAPVDPRDRMYLYSEGFRLIFPDDRQMTEEEITEHQRQAFERYIYFSQHLLAVNYIDEYITFLTQNAPKELERLSISVEPVDLTQKHEEILDNEQKYVSENVSEVKKERRRKRENPL